MKTNLPQPPPFYALFPYSTTYLEIQKVTPLIVFNN